MRLDRSWRAVGRVLRSTARVLRRAADDVAGLVVPAECRVCEAPLERAGLVPVCATCVGRVKSDTPLGCGRCGEAVNLDLDMEDLRFASLVGEGMLCRECTLAAPEFERAVSYGTYGGELRALIGLLKFGRVRAVSRLLGGRLAETVLRLEGEAAQELLVIAVPLFGRRERQRGWNQSVLLAAEALKRLQCLRPGWRLQAAHGALRRRRRTESSFGLSRRQRRLNMKGAFEVAQDVRGREVLLVDDILTTGATARECARVLRRAGATKVWVATLARAQKGFLRRQHENPGEYVAAWSLPASEAGVNGKV